MTDGTITYPLDWEGIALAVRWTPDWLNMAARGYGIAHLELVSEGYPRNNCR